MSGQETEQSKRHAPSSMYHQVPHLVGVLTAAAAAPLDTPVHLRHQAARGLGTLWPRCAAEPDLAARWAGPVGRALATAARDDSPWVRSAAIRGLERVGGREASAAVADLLEDDDADVRRRAVLAIGRLGPDALLPRLLDLLDRTSDPELTLMVAEAMAHLRRPEPEAIATLHDYRRRGGGSHLTRTAIRSLAHIGRTAPHLAGQITSDLHSAMYSTDPDQRLAGLQGLAILQPARWTEHGVRALRDAVPLIRAAAVELLLKHAGPDAVREAGKLTTDRDRWVRARFAGALASHLDRPDARALLDRLSKDREPTVAKAAYRVLAATGPDGVRPGLAHPNHSVRSQAVMALPDLGDSTDLPRLQALLSDRNAGVRWTAVRSLVRLRRRLRPSPRPDRGRFVEPIASMLHDEHPYVCREAALALAELGGRDAAAHLDRARADGRIDRYTADRVQQALGRRSR